MNILHWMKKENSGLVRSALEIAHWEERLGHSVCIKEPSGGNDPIYGTNGKVDLHMIHSQLDPKHYHDGVPKLMMMHGEPLSSVANRVSMKAILDLAPACDAFLCMRREELSIWSSIKRTHHIPKGIDLEVYSPRQVVEKLSGSPAVLYCENWRGERNPLYLCIAMQEVHRKYPGARLHLYNCQDQKMFDTFRAMWQHNHWWPFLRTLSGPVDDVVELYNRADIVVSCLHPLYARGIEAFGCGKAFICPGYREPGYPWTCDLDPLSMADAIIACHEGYDTVDYRRWAVDHHNAEESTKQAIAIYERYTL